MPLPPAVTIATDIDQLPKLPTSDGRQNRRAAQYSLRLADPCLLQRKECG
jgi:hypothetical protein